VDEQHDVAATLLEVDLDRKRIGLTARKSTAPRGNAVPRDPADANRTAGGGKPAHQGGRPAQGGKPAPGGNQRPGQRGPNNAPNNAPRPSGDGKNLSHNPFAAHFNKR